MKRPPFLPVFIGTGFGSGFSPFAPGTAGALLAVPNDDCWFWYVIAAFALFRIFDIAKPLGIRRMESLKGGVGVMMDDVLAGVYSFILLVGARWVIG